MFPCLFCLPLNCQFANLQICKVVKLAENSQENGKEDLECFPQK